MLSAESLSLSSHGISLCHESQISIKAFIPNQYKLSDKTVIWPGKRHATSTSSQILNF